MAKNPFAVRDGKVVCIADLSIKERGLRCNCRCVSCQAPLIAKMGEVNEHHFAHSEKLCDEGQAYIQGMYQLAKEILDNARYITLPGIKVAFQYSISPLINADNISQHIRIVEPDAKEVEHMHYISLFDKTTISITETYIKYKHNKNIEALIVKSDTKELAIKIALPPTICKDYKSKQIKDLSTLEIDFVNEDYKLNTLRREEIAQIIISDISYKRWISNLKVAKIYPQIIEENDRFIDEYNRKQEEIKAKRRAWEEKQRESRKRELKEHLMMKSEIVVPAFSVPKKTIISHEEQIDRGYKEIAEKFDKESTEIIRDSFGNRWVYCILCKRIKHVDEMGSYGGGRPNIGKCSECFR